jgi:Ca2+-binding EF-hand superfamily protein
MKDRFDMMDSNGDGFIDQAEQDAMRRQFSGGGGRPGGGAGGRPEN